MTDRADYYVKKGVCIREVLPEPPVKEAPPVVAPQPQEVLLKCKNYGCNISFREEENHDTACRHHTAPPIFHDRIKGWNCCKEKKVYDWDEFRAIQGCAVGRHSTVDPKLLFQSSPTVDAAKAAEAKSEAAQIKSIADFNTQNPDAATASASALKTVARKSTRKPDGTARCQNKGCQKVFNVRENNARACTFHVGQAVFHDVAKYWSCCDKKKCFDFDEFMKVTGCRTGYHDDGEIDPSLLTAE